MEPTNKPKEEQAPRITKAEVVKWENDFKEHVSALVKFDTQDNGYSMKFYNGDSGIDAYWSGTIILKADNYLKWNYSMLNGVFMECKMNLDETNQQIPANLYTFFKQWQTEVSKSLAEPGAEETQQDDSNVPAPQNPDLVGPESNNAAEPTQAPPPLAEGSLIGYKRVEKSRKDTIMDSAARMKRLAGL